MKASVLSFLCCIPYFMFAQSIPERARSISQPEVYWESISNFPDSLRKAAETDAYIFHAALLPASASDQTTLYVFSPIEKTMLVGIYDLGDTCLWENKIKLISGENAVPIALYQLPEDWYWLKVEYGTRPEIYYFPLLIDRQ